MLPLYTVAKCGFRAMLKKFNSRYELPSRNELSSIQYFSVTTDLWSSPAMEPYMTYTVHYINADWELFALQASFTPEDHTGET